MTLLYDTHEDVRVNPTIAKTAGLLEFAHPGHLPSAIDSGIARSA